MQASHFACHIRDISFGESADLFDVYRTNKMSTARHLSILELQTTEIICHGDVTSRKKFFKTEYSRMSGCNIQNKEIYGFLTATCVKVIIFRIVNITVRGSVQSHIETSLHFNIADMATLHRNVRSNWGNINPYTIQGQFQETD